MLILADLRTHKYTLYSLCDNNVEIKQADKNYL